ncbi:MAG: hypothetical protein M3Z50_02140 [Actinomycetota bacterium]|nr:hypothetical protein [Actinomycetota bacterium]
MDELLMLHGVTGWCASCDAETIFLPVDELGSSCCTGCDSAVVTAWAA